MAFITSKRHTRFTHSAALDTNVVQDAMAKRIESPFGTRRMAIEQKKTIWCAPENGFLLT